MCFRISCEETPISCPALYICLCLLKHNVLKALKVIHILSKQGLRDVALKISKGFSHILWSFTKLRLVDRPGTVVRLDHVLVVTAP